MAAASDLMTPLAVQNVPRGGLSDGKFRNDNFIKEQKYSKKWT